MTNTQIPIIRPSEARAAAVAATPMREQAGSQRSEAELQNAETIRSPITKVDDGLLRRNDNVINELADHSTPRNDNKTIVSNDTPNHDEKAITHNEKEEPSSHKWLENGWRKFREYFKNSPRPFKLFRDSFTMGLNVLGVLMNFGAVIAKGIPAVGPKITEWLDKKSEWFSRYVVPLSFAWNSIEATAGNRFIEAAARLVPAVLFWVLPFYNFNMATGIASGINFLLHLIDDRYNGKTPDASPLQNIKATFNKLGEMISDFASGRFRKGEKWDIFAVLGMLLGSAGGLVFAGKQRDSWAARIFGFVRNLAGLTGDARFVIGNDVHKRVAGASMIFASIANIFMRWVGDDAARILNHLAVALDDFGLTYWAHESKRRNDQNNKVSELSAQPSRVQNVMLHAAATTA